MTEQAHTAEQKLAGLLDGRQFNGNTPAAAAVGIPTLRAGDLHLGDTVANIPIGISLAKLIDGRLLIQGNSGAGKSMLLRRLFEQAFGKVQLLLVDSDGEFTTLSEHFDVAVITAADVLRVGAHAFALHVRAHCYSAILDLSDATSEQRTAIVADLGAGLVGAPEAHWTPILVLVDETQTFVPRYDPGDIETETRKRAVAALSDMMGRGRKRGIAGVIATARISETSTPVISKATNIIVGRTIFDRDVERAGAMLGFTVGQSRPLRTLADGEFLCLGPAIAGPKRVRFRTGPVKSRHKGRAPELVAPPTISAAAAGALLQKLPSVVALADHAEPRAGHKQGSGRRGRDWLQAEDAIIRAGYGRGASIREIGAELAAIGFSTSTSNISGRAHSLGLVSVKAGADWTDAEDQIVRDAYVREVKIVDIVALLAAQGFERGRVSVQMRAINLGITRDRVNYWTEAEKKIAIAGLESGKPYREIIQDLKDSGFHRGSTSIFKFATKHNFSRAPDPWTHEQIAKMKELYEQKMPVKQIAEILQKPIAAIRSRASNMGLKQRVAWTEAEYEILRRCCEDGRSLGDAAQEIGRPYPNVAQVACRIGLTFKAKRAA